MTQFPSIVRALSAVSVVAAFATACGGNSFSSHSDGGDAGSTNEGGSSSVAGRHTTGGKTTTGGSGSGAGTGQGGGSSGSSVGGTGMGGSAAAGAGGTDLADACSGPYEAGNMDCLGFFPSWTHDEKTGVCMPIVYGGCGGTKNLYKTLAECQTACPGGEPNYDACKLPTDCTFVAGGCCGVCDSPNVTGHDFIAVNKMYAAEVAQCAGDVACGACPPSDDLGTLKYFVPNCVQGQCIVQDLRESPVTACKASDECKIRSGNGCCPSCAPDAQLLSVRNDGSFEKLVCGNLLPPCAACLPAPDAVAVCSAEGRCDIAYGVNN